MITVPQYLICNVYECTKDIHTGKVNYHMRQENNPIPVLDVTIYRNAVGEAPNTIVANYKDILEHNAGQKVELEVLSVFPLRPQFENWDDPKLWGDGRYTVVQGTMIKQVKRDPNKPVIVMQGQSKSEAIKRALTPEEVAVPFIMLVPETSKYMYDLKICHTPVTAVEEWDSSKKEVDPLLNNDDNQPPMAIDPTGLHLGDSNGQSNHSAK